MLTICSIRASSRDDKGGAGGGGEEEDGESPSALLILSGSAAIICSANVSTLASSSPIKRNHHPSQTRKTYYRTAEITLITTSRIFCSFFLSVRFFILKPWTYFYDEPNRTLIKRVTPNIADYFVFIYIYAVEISTWHESNVFKQANQMASVDVFLSLLNVPFYGWSDVTRGILTMCVFRI